MAVRHRPPAPGKAGLDNPALARLRPPEDAQEANDSLSAAEKDFAAALRNAAAALKGGQLADGPKILERQMRSSRAPAELDDAVARLKTLGYTNS